MSIYKKVRIGKMFLGPSVPLLSGNPHPGRKPLLFGSLLSWTNFTNSSKLTTAKSGGNSLYQRGEGKEERKALNSICRHSSVRRDDKFFMPALGQEVGSLESVTCIFPSKGQVFAPKIGTWPLQRQIPSPCLGQAGCSGPWSAPGPSRRGGVAHRGSFPPSFCSFLAGKLLNKQMKKHWGFK